MKSSEISVEETEDNILQRRSLDGEQFSVK